jgi:hypothetical protein
MQVDLPALITSLLAGTGTVGLAIAVTILIAVLSGGDLGDRARQVLRILRLGPSDPSGNQDPPGSDDQGQG